MITDPKEQKEFFTIPETVTNPDEFKSWFNETFIRKDKIAVDKELRSEIAGAALGAEMTNLKRAFKEKGIEFTEEEFKSFQELKSHKNEAMVEAAIAKIQGLHANEKSEWEKKLGAGGDERVKDLELKLEKLNKKYVETDNAWKTTASELETEKKNGAAKMTQYKISTLLSEKLKQVKLKQKLTPSEQLGWDTGVEKKLKFELNETGDDLEVFNEKGERMPSKTKAGTFLNTVEALQELADTLELSEINPHGGKQIQSPQHNIRKPGAGQNNNQGGEGKTILQYGKVVKI